ncbi:MAG TPA: hemolysin III family protein [Mycobacteriales bacterium]|jgi:hemolysin III|nr:hemolysin III family protein [Mycobacteriales bacterium]
MTALSAASAGSQPLQAIKPRLRGWLHQWAFVVSFATGATLIALSALEGTRAVIGTSIYALTVSLLFGTSALYHRRTWAARGRSVMKRLDHSMIFVFIAGTYTPFALLVMPRNIGIVILTVVWSGALAGIVLKQAWIRAPRWISVPPYIALGWVAVFVLPDMLRHAGVAALVLLLAGGLVYSFGAIVYGTRRPDPWPRTFGYHEVFHLCTIVAALCHYIAIWFAVYSR